MAGQLIELSENLVETESSVELFRKLRGRHVVGQLNSGQMALAHAQLGGKGFQRLLPPVCAQLCAEEIARRAVGLKLSWRWHMPLPKFGVGTVIAGQPSHHWVSLKAHGEKPSPGE